MKNTLKYIICSLSLSTLFVGNIAAKEAVQDGTVAIQVNELAQYKDSLHLNMNIVSDGKSVSTNHSMDLVPVLVASGHEKELPKVSLKGRNSLKAYNRSLALMSKSEKADFAATAPYSVVADYKKGPQDITYDLTIPYEPWMSKAQLKLRKDDCGCGKSRVAEDGQFLANVTPKLTLEDFVPSLSYKYPVAEPIKARQKEGISYLDFVVNKFDISPNYRNNASELATIENLIESVNGDKDITINKISIIGYASPEGPLDNNRILSENRAKALSGYLQKKYTDLDKNLYNVEYGGENWDDMITMITNSEMPEKNELLSIIDKYTDRNECKSKLMMYKGGSVWKTIVNTMCPALRKVKVKVDYNVRNFSLEEAKAMAKTNPEKLSLNELFIVAETYKVGSKEYNELFQTSVKLYPESAMANLNAGISALSNQDLVAADNFLKKVRTRDRIPEYDNALGVLSILKDADVVKAEQYFKSAKQAGLPAASKNIEFLEKLKN